MMWETTVKTYFPGLAAACRRELIKILPAIVETAREYGYTVALHGSAARDIDLIAVPWTESAWSAEDVAEAILKSAEKKCTRKIAIVAPHEIDKTPFKKPHGRLCWSFQLGSGVYIDLSVMPRIQINRPTGKESI